MSLIRFLLILGFGTALSWTAWVLVLTMLDPQTGGLAAIGLFYLSWWLALLGTVTIIGFFARYWLEKDGVMFRQLSVALRQALLLSAGATVALMLQSRRLLSVWTMLSLIILLFVAESFFLAGQTDRSRQSS